jgi:predicted SPOUT superfamily RNA methylase MTH1
VVGVAPPQEGGKDGIDAKRRTTRLSMAIPSSLASEASHLREKTGIIGQVARASAIYRVEDIYIYRDPPDESNLIRLILGYIETPQYLRRRLFSKRPELRYVGALPPLRTPHHPLERRAEHLNEGEFREGVVLSGEGEGFFVDIGVDRPLRAEGRAPSVGSRATVQVLDTEPELIGKFVRRRDIDQYWGYNVHVTGEDLERLVRKEEFDLTIATSRHASPFIEVETQLRERWEEARNVLVAFGSPRRGVGEMLAKKGLKIEEVFHLAVNVIPLQGCESVRTEEAIHASLAVLNLLGG